MDDRVTSSTYDLLKPFPDEAMAASTWRSAAGTATSTEKVRNHTEGNGARQRGGMRELPTADTDCGLSGRPRHGGRTPSSFHRGGP